MNNLKRFIDAQEGAYSQALAEIKNGRKSSHWMWYVFPQLRGLGRSSMSEYYGIADLHEAEQYMQDAVLGARLVEIAEAFYGLEGDPKAILGSPDHLKMKSCMTLFDQVCPHAIFDAVLEKFYRGQRCHRTLSMLKKEE